jgi:pyruvate ferredoxin oxidoreductase gamma subunit/2-oxoisovalerate ferredoxin oxidoreductase gamma subunit
MLEIRFHGKGGDGAVLAGKMLGVAASLDKKIAQVVPAYQATRRGGDVDVHLRISDKPIYVTSRVYNPDGIVVFNTNWKNEKKIYLAGLKEKGFAVINTRDKPKELDINLNLSKVGVVDATGIALETIQRTIPNTAMLGALCKTTDIVKLGSLKKAIKNVFPEYLHEKNVFAVEKAYNDTVVEFEING